MPLPTSSPASYNEPAANEPAANRILRSMGVPLARRIADLRLPIYEQGTAKSPVLPAIVNHQSTIGNCEETPALAARARRPCVVNRGSSIGDFGLVGLEQLNVAIRKRPGVAFAVSYDVYGFAFGKQFLIR